MRSVGKVALAFATIEDASEIDEALSIPVSSEALVQRVKDLPHAPCREHVRGGAAGSRAGEI